MTRFLANSPRLLLAVGVMAGLFSKFDFSEIPKSPIFIVSALLAIPLSLLFAWLIVWARELNLRLGYSKRASEITYLFQILPVLWIGAFAGMLARRAISREFNYELIGLCAALTFWKGIVFLFKNAENRRVLK